MSLGYLRIKPRQTCQNMNIGNKYTKALNLTRNKSVDVRYRLLLLKWRAFHDVITIASMALQRICLKQCIFASTVGGNFMIGLVQTSTEVIPYLRQLLPLYQCLINPFSTAPVTLTGGIIQEPLSLRNLIYSDDSFIRTLLSPADTSGLTSFPDYWVAY